MSNTKYVNRLQSFYADKGLCIRGFSCQHTNVCAKAAGCALSRGAEAHVGTRYGEGIRVVVVSLDTGGDNDSMDRRRSKIEDLHPNGGNNAHMRGTTQLLQAIYGTEPNIDSGNLYELYAMTNTAKCSRCGPSSTKVPGALYRNCSEYVAPELACLVPQMIVTQGREAWWALDAPRSLSDAHRTVLDHWIADLSIHPVVRNWLWSLATEYLMTASVAERDVPILKTTHPSARSGQWQRFARTDLQPVVAMAKHLARSVHP